MNLRNNVSYLAIHARGIPIPRLILDNDNRYRTISDIAIILLPDINGNLETVLDSTLKNIKEKGILK